MLKAADKEKLKIFKIDPEALIKAIQDEKEVDFAVPDVTVLTAAELATRDGIKIAEGEKAAEPKVRSVLIKEVGTKLGFEPKGERIGDLVTELQAQMNKGDDAKVAALTEQVNLLTKDKESLSAAVTAEKERAEKASFESELIGYFPAGRSADLADRERLGILTSAITFKTVDGKRVAERNGEIVRDPATQAPLPADQVVKGYFTERKWDVAPAAGGGRGGADSKSGDAGGLKTYGAVEAQWKKDNPGGNTMSPAFMDYVNKIAKDNPDFDFNVEE